MSAILIPLASRELALDEDDLSYSFSCSSGPGGQNVNSVETRVTLHFDLNASRGLTEPERRRIAERLATRVNREGVLRVTVQRHRTREANRRAAVERFVELIAQALHQQAPRRPTKVSKAKRRQRLNLKRQRGEKKRGRSGNWDD